ncbi:TIR-like protein FxsC [Cryptosporangium aurantiacum]|uniref:FxsC C-terminal domain-containing protein n=1 Tax=Cryptosporangium aurantiacum TaxID=134849 RepID=A0A1M7L3G1_9ACTN|nr:TIR-like protein FxsC [Cryptosporangium aurantiacum]SHM71831.1 FxsC C-terminal domain-containing protein [Cryptosporangium aurantiacum]
MDTPAGRRSSSGAYFFVSYAQVPPIEGEEPRSDPLVDTFFTDLVTHVGRHATDTSRRLGLYDKTLEPGRDWGNAVGHALSEAEVFVPLYSPRYFRGSWTRRERLLFEDRLRAAHADPARHIKPVLWMPLPPGTSTASTGAEALGRGVPQYAELGLGPLCDVARTEPAGTYRDAYEEIVDRLAKQIVDVAEHSPIGPSPAASPATTVPVSLDVADFVIAVFAPTAESPPSGADPVAYGATALAWSPFAATRPVPIAQQASYVTERLDLNATVTAVPGAHPLWTQKPAILLVDVWQAADPDASPSLLQVLKGLPSWVLPVAITDGDDSGVPARAAEARARTLAMLTDAGAEPRLAAADGYDRFMNVMPTLVTRARRRFFREIPSSYPGRPRLGGTDSVRRAVEGDD